MTRGERTTPVDEVSRAIIEQLQEDGRRAYATIGKAVGLSEAAVRQRVQRLVDGGVLHVVAVADPAALGLERQAMVAVSVSGPHEPAAEAIAALPEVASVVVTTGRHDLLVEVLAEDDAHLLDVVSRGIRRAPGVTSTETSVHLQQVKRPHASR